MSGMKNIPKNERMTLASQIDYQPGQVVSKTLAQNNAVSLTLFSFEKGEEISTHVSGGDAMVQVLEGTGRFTVDGVPHILHEGESIVFLMPSLAKSASRCCSLSFFKSYWAIFPWQMPALVSATFL